MRGVTGSAVMVSPRIADLAGEHITAFASTSESDVYLSICYCCDVIVVVEAGLHL